MTPKKGRSEAVRACRSVYVSNRHRQHSLFFQVRVLRLHPAVDIKQECMVALSNAKGVVRLDAGVAYSDASRVG